MAVSIYTKSGARIVQQILELVSRLHMTIKYINGGNYIRNYTLRENWKPLMGAGQRRPSPEEMFYSFHAISVLEEAV